MICWCLTNAHPAHSATSSTLNKSADSQRPTYPSHPRQKVFVLKNIPAEEAAKAVKSLLTPGYGASAFDPRSNKVILTDHPHVVEAAQKLIEEIDKPNATRVIKAKPADGSTTTLPLKAD